MENEDKDKAQPSAYNPLRKIGPLFGMVLASASVLGCRLEDVGKLPEYIGPYAGSHKPKNLFRIDEHGNMIFEEGGPRYSVHAGTPQEQGVPGKPIFGMVMNFEPGSLERRLEVSNTTPNDDVLGRHYCVPEQKPCQ